MPPRWSSNSGRPDSGGVSEDDQHLWDYCTPARQENIEADEDGGMHTMKPVTIPEKVDGGKDDGGVSLQLKVFIPLTM